MYNLLCSTIIFLEGELKWRVARAWNGMENVEGKKERIIYDWERVTIAAVVVELFFSFYCRISLVVLSSHICYVEIIGQNYVVLPSASFNI